MAGMRMFTDYFDMKTAARHKHRSRIQSLRIAAALGLSAMALLSFAGCGFKISGFDLQLPFQTIAIQGSQEVTRDLRRLMGSQQGLKIVSKPAEAQVVLAVTGQNLERFVVAYSSAGRPREIQLRMRVAYRITDGFGVELTAPQEISQARDISVNESEVLAMASAEDFMKADMNQDIAQQLVRRLRAVKLPRP